MIEVKRGDAEAQVTAVIMEEAVIKRIVSTQKIKRIRKIKNIKRVADTDKDLHLVHAHDSSKSSFNQIAFRI